MRVATLFTLALGAAGVSARSGLLKHKAFHERQADLLRRHLESQPEPARESRQQPQHLNSKTQKFAVNGKALPEVYVRSPAAGERDAFRTRRADERQAV